MNSLVKMALRMNAAEEARGRGVPAGLTPKTRRQIEDEAMAKAIGILEGGARSRAEERAHNIQVCEAYLKKAARKASAPAPALPPVAGDKPKAPKKPAPLQAPGRRRWMTLYELQNADKAVAYAILHNRIRPPQELRDFGGHKLAVWDYDRARVLAARMNA